MNAAPAVQSVRRGADTSWSGFRSGRFVSCGFEVVCAFTWAEAIETGADGAPQAFDSSFGGFSQQVFTLERGFSIALKSAL